MLPEIIEGQPRVLPIGDGGPFCVRFDRHGPDVERKHLARRFEECSNAYSHTAGWPGSCCALAAPSFTKTSITAAGVDPIFLNPCIVPLSMKYACPGVASTGFAEPMVSSIFPVMGINRWNRTSLWACMLRTAPGWSSTRVTRTSARSICLTGLTPGSAVLAAPGVWALAYNAQNKIKGRARIIVRIFIFRLLGLRGPRARLVTRNSTSREPSQTVTLPGQPASIQRDVSSSSRTFFSRIRKALSCRTAGQQTAVPYYEYRPTGLHPARGNRPACQIVKFRTALPLPEFLHSSLSRRRWLACVRPASTIRCNSRCSKYPGKRVGIPESVPNAIFTPASVSAFRFFLPISSPALYLAISASLRLCSRFSGL